MNKIPVSQLRPNMIFDKPVYVSGKDILVGAYEPLKVSDYERLKKWKIDYVTTEGKIISEMEAEKYLQDLVSQITEKKAPTVEALYSFSVLNPQETEIAKKHNEWVNLLRENFELASLGKLMDISALKNAANSLIALVEKNKRIILKFVFIGSEEPSDFVYYQAVNSAIVAVLTGLELKYSRLSLTNLVLGALLHDIGIIKISPEILLKKEKLNDLELMALKKHPVLGHKMIETTNSFSADVATIVLQHHERMDGSGYPYGLRGAQIIEYARVTAICDAYVAMCSKREHREPISPPSIIKSLLKDSMGKLDPNLLKIFVYTVGIYPVGIFVKLNNGAIGEIMLQNMNALAKPVIKIYIDQHGQAVTPPSVLNLALEQTVELEKVLTNEEKKEVIGRLGRK